MFGAWQVGAWQALEPVFKPDLVVGASVGSLNGWMIASGCPPEELACRWRSYRLDGAASNGKHPHGFALPGLLSGVPVLNLARHLCQVYRPKIPLRVFSADGHLIGEFGEERRSVVPIEQVPDSLKHAIIAAEDERFYQHSGIDYMGIARAAHALGLLPRADLEWTKAMVGGAINASSARARERLGWQPQYDATDTLLAFARARGILAEV